MKNSLSHSTFYQHIEGLIQQAKAKVAAAVNFAMVEVYWNIGKIIVEEEQKGNAKAVYGEQLIPMLSKQLTQQFGKGFSKSNLAYMRQFYNMFSNFHAVRGNLSWTHYRLIMKVQNEKARTFYIQETAENQWSTRTLDRQINSF